jgi:hypothetical protein
MGKPPLPKQPRCSCGWPAPLNVSVVTANNSAVLGIRFDCPRCGKGLVLSGGEPAEVPAEPPTVPDGRAS